MTAYDTYLAAFSPIARWKFDDGSVINGATCADDEGANDGTYTHGAGSIGTDASPIVGDTQAIDQAGGAYTRILSPTAALIPADDRTVLVWLNINTGVTSGYIYHSSPDTNNRLAIFLNGTKFECRSRVGGVTRSVQTTNVVTTNSWHMLGIHIGGSSDRVATWDGVDVTAASTAALPTTGAVATMGARLDGIVPFNGLLADIAVTENMTVAEARAAYEAATVTSADYPNPLVCGAVDASLRGSVYECLGGSVY